MSAPAPRLATPADVPAVEDVVRAAYTPWIDVIGVRPGPLDSDYAALVAAGSVYVTPAVDGVLVLVPEADDLLVENVAVLPEFQGQGLGRMLLDFAEARARELGLPAVRLYTHERMTSNVELYQARGYTVTGWQPVDVGRLIHLRKRL